jgi:hypothetical protein
MAAIAVAGVGMMVMCSSSVAAMMMMGGDGDDAAAGAGAGAGAGAEDSGPSCNPDQAFTEQTGTVACESIDDFKPTAATWWGTYINNSVPISSTEATAAGQTHSFHELSSTATNKKYIAMRKTDQHCKMIEIDVTKDGPNCNYSIKDAGYAGYGGGGMGATDACVATTDAEVVAKWNAKTATPTARTAATDTGYGLKSIKYSMYC